MLALVNDLLEVSKLESTVGTFHLERIDLRGIVHPVVQELEPLLTRNQQAMHVQMSDLPLVAKVDPLRLQQVIRNVLANAIKFSPQGSAITLLGQVDAQGQVHLEVRDEGPGVPEAELEKIFEAFVQSSKTKDGSGGTGLGLAICRKIIEAMGGQIFARNLAPKGASFHIILPARGFAETQPAPL
jgi:signal transduction histidine kinase